MAKTHETIADIIAWLRRPREGENAYLTTWRDEIADRLEAALKREKTAIEADALTVGGIVEAERKRERGDAAKLREALKLCVDEMCNRCHESAAARGNPLPCMSGCEPVRKAKAALAAPPRNCDVGTAQEQDERFHRFCVKHRTGSCAGCHNPVGDYTVANGVRECALVWAQMPYEEGGGR